MFLQSVLQTVQRCEHLIWTDEARNCHKTRKFTTTVYLKNITIWCRYCAPICTESTSFCEHNFGNQEH